MTWRLKRTNEPKKMNINKTTQMKSLMIAVTLFIGSMLFSCSTSTPGSEEDFLAIESDIKQEFGADAYYTNFVIMFNKTVGTMISTTVTDNPESLKMGEWNQSQGTWNQSAEVTLELPEGTKAVDFMFQLNDEINVKSLGKLVEKSKEKLMTEKDIKNPAVEMAFIQFPDNGDKSKAKYVVKLAPQNGGTSFSFFYDLNGEFIEMDY